jgi:ribonuclease HII
MSEHPDFSIERDVLDHSDDLFMSPEKMSVIGIDEAGRGPWAGPVTAAAAWINPDALAELPKGLTDSKKISPKKRQALFHSLTCLPQDIFRYAAISRDATEIDANGILSETFTAMDMAASILRLNHDGALTVLVDGNLAPPMPKLTEKKVDPVKVIPVVKGDARSLSIAAASIVAKETRDQAMKTLDQDYPGYGWAINMGYGTADHRAGLAKQGPTKHHRLCYKPVAVVAAQFGYTR